MFERYRDKNKNAHSERNSYSDQKKFVDRNNYSGDRNDRFDNRNGDRERTPKFEDRRGGMRGGQGRGRGGRGGGRDGGGRGGFSGGQEKRFPEASRDNRDNRNTAKNTDRGVSNKEKREIQGRDPRENRGLTDPIFVHGSGSDRGSESRSDRFVEDLFRDSKPPSSAKDIRCVFFKSTHCIGL